MGVVRWGVLGGCRRVMLAVRASPLSESESGQALAGKLLIDYDSLSTHEIERESHIVSCDSQSVTMRIEKRNPAAVEDRRHNIMHATPCALLLMM